MGFGKLTRPISFVGGGLQNIARNPEKGILGVVGLAIAGRQEELKNQALQTERVASGLNEATLQQKNLQAEQARIQAEESVRQQEEQARRKTIFGGSSIQNQQRKQLLGV